MEWKKSWNFWTSLSLLFQEAAAEEGAAAVQVLVAQGKTIDKYVVSIQCDQIGRFIGLWASFKVFGNN